MTEVNIALVQQRCEKGALTENISETLRAIYDAASREIDIIAFPEANLTGYVDLEGHPQAPVAVDSGPIKGFVAATQGTGVTALAGLVERNPGGLPYLTQLVVRDGEVVGTYRKVTIVDDDRQLYTPGTEYPIFRHDTLTFGIAICSDIGNESVYANLASRGARIIFEVAAPGLYGDQATRSWQSGYEWWAGECEQYLSAYAASYGVWVAVATQAGRTLDEDFPGGGYVFSPTGERAYTTRNWSPGTVYLTLDLDGEAVRPIP